MLTLEELRVSVAAGDIDTVIVALTDMQGRLQGKRFHARYFLDEVVPHSTEACAYLLAVDTDMNTVDGYELASWETGYGDFMLVPDFDTLRLMPWQPGTALVLADVAALGGGRLGGGGGGPGRRGRSRPGVAPPGAAGTAGAGGGARLDRHGGHRTRVRRLRGRLRAGLGLRLPVARPREPLQRRLLRARHRADRAAAARHQELDG